LMFYVTLPKIVNLLSATDISAAFPRPTKWGRYNMFFHHVVIKIRHLFLRPAACLTSTLLETKVGANDCKCSRDQQLNVPSEARTRHGRIRQI
jgi:hypothetical protein